MARLLELVDVCRDVRCRTGVRLALSFFGVVFSVDGDMSFVSVAAAFCLGGSVFSTVAIGTFRGRPRFTALARFTSVDWDRLRCGLALAAPPPSSSLLSLNADFATTGCFRFRRVDDIRLDALSLLSSSEYARKINTKCMKRMKTLNIKH